MNGYPLPETTDTVMELVFESEAASGVNIDGFAQWADDARKVNLYLHDAASVLAADPVGSTEVCSIPPTSPAPEPISEVQRLLPVDDLAPIADTAPATVVVIVD